MKKIKVCLISHGLGANGIDTFIKNVAVGLDKEQFDVTVIMAVDKGGKPQFWEETVQNSGCKIFRVGDLDGLKKKILFRRNLTKILNETGPYDALHANMDMLNGIVLKVANRLKIPVRVAHSHVSQSQYELKKKTKILSKIYKFCMRQSIWKNSSYRFGCSELAMNYMYQDKWRKCESAKVLYNGVSFCKVEAHLLRANRLYTVARFVEQKNPFFVVDIMEQLVKKRKDFVFYWIGDGPLRAKTEQLVEEKGLQENFQFLGIRTDVLNILSQGKVFLQPSFFEGLSIALIEAQSAGLKCLVSNTTTQESDCGLCEFLPINDATLWADRIAEILDEEPKEADKPLLYRFSIENTVEKLSEIYKGKRD